MSCTYKNKFQNCEREGEKFVLLHETACEKKSIGLPLRKNAKKETPVVFPSFVYGMHSNGSDCKP